MSSGDLTSRELAVLRHIARYQLTFTEILRRLLFDGTDPKRTLGELTEKGLIETRKGYGGNRSAYVLTVRGTRAAGASQRRASLGGAAGEARNLALLGFCCLRGQPRIRLNGEELLSVLGVRVRAERNHCLEWGSRRKRLYRMYVPDPGQAPDAIARYVRDALDEQVQSATLRPWVESGVYQTAVVVDDSSRAAAINARLDETHLDERPLREVAEIHVDVVPGPATLEEALHALA